MGLSLEPEGKLENARGGPPEATAPGRAPFFYGSIRMPTSRMNSQKEKNMSDTSWEEDHNLFHELLWPYRYLFGGLFNSAVKEITDDYRRKRAPGSPPGPREKDHECLKEG